LQNRLHLFIHTKFVQKIRLVFCNKSIHII
jgi:hypothetical protein